MLTCDDCRQPIPPAEVATRGTLHLACWVLRTLRAEAPIGGTLSERLARAKS